MKVVLMVSCFVAAAMATSWEKCPSAGESAIPDPSSCSHYFACKDGEAKALACPEGLHYSNEAHACVEKEVASCNLCQYNTRRVRFFSAEDSCSKYHMCFGQERVELECANGYFFNQETGTCDRASSVSCHLRQNRNHHLLASSLTRSCPNNNRVTFLPDLQSCHFYFICDGGRPELHDCGGNWIFNIDEQRCTATGRCILDFQPNCPNSRQLTSVGHPFDCRHFFWCDNGEALLDSCPPGELFDVRSSRCARENIAVCERPPQNNNPGFWIA